MTLNYILCFYIRKIEEISNRERLKSAIENYAAIHYVVLIFITDNWKIGGSLFCDIVGVLGLGRANIEKRGS